MATKRSDLLQACSAGSRYYIERERVKPQSDNEYGRLRELISVIYDRQLPAGEVVAECPNHTDAILICGLLNIHVAAEYGRLGQQRREEEGKASDNSK